MRAMQLIAEANYGMGSPGLVKCMQVLGDNFDNLSPEMQCAYEEMYEELMEFVQQQTEQGITQ